MVFFTCAGCGESIKKAQVQKHRYQCRRSQILTCIDCNKDFYGDDYQSHTKCLSEDQKYGGQNYVGKANKGEVKQEKWFEQVQRAIDSIDSKDARLRNLLEQVKNFPNVPRKQQKFESFLANSLRIRDQHLIHAAWQAIAASVEKEKTKDEPKNVDVQSANGDEAISKRKVQEEEDEKSKSKKQKIAEDENAAATESVADNANETVDSTRNGTVKKKFNWRKSIKQRLISIPEKEMKLKSLRKEVMRQYKEVGKQKECTQEELQLLFDKAIKRLSDREFLILEGKIVRVLKNC